MRLLTLARDLTRRKARERDGLFVAEGVRSVAELLNSPLELVGLLCAPQLSASERGRALRDAAARRSIEVTDVSDREFATAAGTESPQGVLAVGKIPVRSLETLVGHSSLRVLILDAVQDPGNVGTILRTAAALGADATVALPGTVDLWNAKVVRSAMGANFKHLAFHATWETTHDFLAREAISLWSAERDGDRIGDADVPARLAVALGNEGAGLSAWVRSAADRRISIPMTPSAESLNVAVAAGILLHELRR